MSPQAYRASKGEETRALILDAAVQQASEAGFESLTIGSLAERTGLSKSGLFAHFGSRTELQIAVLDEAARRYTEAVFMPALKVPRGLRRLRALFANWMAWPSKLPGACPILNAAAEFDDKPGPMRDAVVERQRNLARDLGRAVKLAIETGELREDTDPRQFVFEMFGFALASHHTKCLLGDGTALERASTAFERLVQEHLAAPERASTTRAAAARR